MAFRYAERWAPRRDRESEPRHGLDDRIGMDKAGMISLLKPELTGSVVVGLAMIGVSGSAGAADALPEDIKSTIVELIGTDAEYGDRCVLEDGIFESVGAHSDLAIEIVGFASEQLRSIWRIDRRADCKCPAQIAVAAAAMAPHLAIDIKDLLDTDFEACDDVIASALEQTLAELPAKASGPGGVGGPGLPGPDSLAKNECRNTDNCVAVEPPGSQSASATGR